MPRRNVSDGSKAALIAPKRHFRSTPNNGHGQTGPACLKGANRRHGRSPWLEVKEASPLRWPYFQIELITAAMPIAVNASTTGGYTTNAAPNRRKLGWTPALSGRPTQIRTKAMTNIAIPVHKFICSPSRLGPATKSQKRGRGKLANRRSFARTEFNVGRLSWSQCRSRAVPTSRD